MQTLCREHSSQLKNVMLKTKPSARSILVMSTLPISNQQIKRFRQKTVLYKTLQSLKEIIRPGWPERKENLLNHIKPFFNIRDEITEINGLLVKEERVIVPTSLRKEMKARIHEGHLGIEKCKARARDSMHWPGRNNKITEMSQRCSACLETRA